MHYENVVANPTAQDKTIAAATDDVSGGAVTIYVGEKRSVGNDLEKAGLVGGVLYSLAIGMPRETHDLVLESAHRFTLQKLDEDRGEVPLDSVMMRERVLAVNGTLYLRPEDVA